MFGCKLQKATNTKSGQNREDSYGVVLPPRSNNDGNPPKLQTWKLKAVEPGWKYLPGMDEIPQILQEKSSMVTCAQNASAGEADLGRALDFVAQPFLAELVPVRELISEDEVETTWEDT